MTSDTKVVIKTSLLSAILTVVLLTFVSYFINHTWLWSGSPAKNPTLNVQGSGTAMATPDQSQIWFTVTKTASTQQAAQTQANTFTNKIVADLQNNGIAKNDIQTSNYNSSPNYDDNGNTIINYVVSENITVTIHDSLKVNQVIDIATKDGAENISGPNFTFSDTKQKELENEARVKAITDAKQKAQSMANAAGIHLGKLISLKEDTSPTTYPIHPILMDASGTIANKGVPTQINSGQNSVTVSVTLSYETY